jgi:hypothetical protein
MNFIIFIVVGFVICVQASPPCNNINDPLPSGGAICTSDSMCNGVNSGGICSFEGPTHVCKCAQSWAMPNCTYQRLSKDLAGGLNIGLAFVGVGGVGNFIIGRIGPAVGQLILMLSYYALFCGMCCFLCVDNNNGCAMIVVYIVVTFTFLAGFIWTIINGAFMLQCHYTDSLGYALY